MKLPRRKFLYLAASAVPLSSISRIARAQTYPARPVRVIVPYAPGGPTDVFGRLMAQKLSEQLGKQFYVENMGGGGNVFSRPGPVARSESGRPKRRPRRRFPISRAPVHARLVEYKCRVREQRLGAAMIEKIRRVGATGELPEEPKPIPEYRRI